jgi:serine/threonine-protein kinase
MADPGASDEPQERPKCGRYELLVRIGKGGMASVYLARTQSDFGMTRLHALKVLHPHLSGLREFIDMLMDEAKIASRLHHPNVVSTVDLGRDGDRYYMVMDYVEGVALDRLLRRQPGVRPPELIIPIVIDALRGLHAAHELEDEAGQPLHLVHRDVTPGNVIVGIDGNARIADFGVAKARARVTKTNPGIVKGKAGYVAPEVILDREIDGRADVFSMGVLLWNALTGETLFDTDDLASTLTSLLKKEIPPPSTVGLMPPAIFDGPILTALHRDPQLRHDSALEMAHALSDALAMHGKRGEREDIGAWVLDSFGAQLQKRKAFAASQPGAVTWDPETVEPPSTTAMVRKDPTGQIVHAMPEKTARPDDDPFAELYDASLVDGSLEGAPTTTSEVGPHGIESSGADASSRLRAASAAARSSRPPAAERAAVHYEDDLDEPPSRLGLWVGLGLVALLVTAGAGWFVYASQSEPTQEEVSPTTPAPPAVEEDETPTAPPPAALDLGGDVRGREEIAPAARRAVEEAPAARPTRRRSRTAEPPTPTDEDDSAEVGTTPHEAPVENATPVADPTTPPAANGEAPAASPEATGGSPGAHRAADPTATPAASPGAPPAATPPGSPVTFRNPAPEPSPPLAPAP